MSYLHGYFLISFLKNSSSKLLSPSTSLFVSAPLNISVEKNWPRAWWFGLLITKRSCWWDEGLIYTAAIERIANLLHICTWAWNFYHVDLMILFAIWLVLRSLFAERRLQRIVSVYAKKLFADAELRICLFVQLLRLKWKAAFKVVVHCLLWTHGPQWSCVFIVDLSSWHV